MGYGAHQLNLMIGISVSYSTIKGRKLKKMEPSYINNTVLTNMFDRQLGLAEKTIEKMHEDLQYDYKLEIEELF